MVSDKKSPTSKSKPNQQDVVDCDLILDSEIDKLLDEKAAKSNLTVFNVKSIIRQLIKNRMVQQVFDVKVKRKERAENGPSVRENGTLSSSAEFGCEDESMFCYEPKLTRAKTKELIQNNDQSQLPLWPISPAKLLQVKPSPPSEAQILITAQDLPEESEAEDDEYIPQEADYHAIQSDDDTSMTSLSDIGSPATSSRSAVNRRRRESSLGSPSRLIRTDDESSVFKTPSPKKQIRRSLRDNAIGLRTRSKLPLNDTPLEDLEKQLIPPDITTDMYEWNDSDNDDYLHFLKTFAFSGVPDGGNDDEEADPEYNAMEDEEDDHDQEEHRVDRAVKVSKKELNELMAELFDGYQLSSNEDVEDLLYSVSNQNLPTEPKTGKATASSRHGVTPFIPADTQTVATTESKSTSVDPPDLPEILPIPVPQISSQHTVNDVFTPDSHIAPLPRVPMKLREEPVLPTSVPVNLPKLVLQDAHTHPVPKVPGHSSSSSPQITPPALFTWEMQSTLRHQMQKHIQLLATTYVISSGLEDHQALKAAHSAKSLMMEISTSAESNGIYSVYAGKNLRPAMDVIRNWPPRVNCNNNSPIKKKILEDYNRSSFKNIPQYEKRLIKLICESSAFMYPNLLPAYISSVSSSSSSSLLKSGAFLRSEDNLVVRGIEELKDTKMRIVEKAKIIVQVSLPIRTTGQIYNRIKNSKKRVESTGMKTNSLKEYFDKNIIPVCPADTYLPGEAVAPIQQAPNLLGKKWTKYVECVQEDTLLENRSPRSVIIFNQGGGLKNPTKSTSKRKRKLGNVDATEERPTELLTSSEYQVFTVTNDSGEPQFYFSVPKLSLYTKEGELKSSTTTGPSDGGEPAEGSGNTSNVPPDASHQTSPPTSTNYQPTEEETTEHHDGNGQGDDDDDEEDKEKKKFHYDPTIDDHTEEHTETTDEESASEQVQSKTETEKMSFSSPDQKGIETAEKTPNSRKRKKIPSGSASTTPTQPRSAGGGGSKRHKYNTTPVEQLLESSAQDDDDVVDAFAEAFLQSVRQRLEGKNPLLFAQFLQLLINDCANDLSDQELYARVEEMFKDYPDLVKEFGGLQTAESAFATGNFIQYRENHAQIHFLNLLEKWTVNCPQLKTKIIQKMKSLQDTVLTEAKVVDIMQPLFSQIQDPLILDSFKALFPTIFRPQTILSDTDYEELDLDGGEELGKHETHGHSTTTELDMDTYETVKLPEEKQVIATNSCPCACHEDPTNVHYHTRARHCNKCCLRFQDGKLFLHSGRVMKPVSIEFTSPELAKQVFAPPTYVTAKITRPSSSPSTSAAASMKKPNP